MPTPSSPRQPRSSFELRADALRLAAERLPRGRFGQSGTAETPRRHGAPTKRRQRYQRRVKALIWRAAQGAAYAAGSGVITIAVNWLTT